MQLRDYKIHILINLDALGVKPADEAEETLNAAIISASFKIGRT